MNVYLKRAGALMGALVLSQAIGFATPRPNGDLGTPCPNKMASDVAMEIQDRGGTRKCGLGIRILGIGGSIVGVDCPRVQVLVPAHQKCQGADGEGMKCVTDGTKPVERRECGCGGLMIPYIKTGLPFSCECGEWLNGGQVENFKTAMC